MPAIEHLTCPFCNSHKVWKDGLRYTEHGEVQRFICRECGHRFSETSLNRSGMSEQVERIHTKKSYSSYSLSSDRQVSVTETQGAKNLVEVETRQEKPMREGTAETAGVKGKIFEFAWWLKKQGLANVTIKNYTVMLRLLVQNGANIFDPENVKEVLANINKSNAWKYAAINAYTAFLKMRGDTWKPPVYRRQRKLPFIPLEREIDDLIAGCGKKTATLIQLLKETGMRVGEALRLRWINIDSKRHTIMLNAPEKNGNPRVFKVSSKLIEMLNLLQKKDNRVFACTYTSAKSCLALSRRKIAQKLRNPRLLQIHFHTLRHWRATIEYHKTKDVLHVKEMLGHRKLDTTLLYIQIEEALFKESSDEFHVKVAEKTEEIKALLEVGFEYVCEKNGLMFFRKRK